MKRIKIAEIVSLLGVFLLLSFLVSSAQAGEVIRNGDFSNGLADWVVNPEIDPTWDPLSDGAVNLHPPGVSWEGFQGTVIYQNLNVTGIGSKAFSFSMDLLKINASEGRTINVVLTYVDTDGNVHDIDLVNPDNATVSSDPENITPVTADSTFPADARKLVKIEIEKEDYGEFSVDNITLTADGVTGGSVPLVTGLSAASGGYDTSLTITGSNFGDTQGFVSIAGSSEGITITNTNWSDTSITVTLGEPARSGRVYVVADYVESNPDCSFSVTSPHLTVDIMDDDLTVVKGQTAEFVVTIDFKNGFTTTSGISFTLMDPSGGSVPSHYFTPVPIKNPGGVLLKIETTDLAAGEYPLLIQTLKGGNPYCSVPIFLEVVRVNNIKFYEWDETHTNKNYITQKNVTTQGAVNICYECEVVDSEGKTLPWDNSSITLQSSDPDKVAVYANKWGGYDIYAVESGTANLTATAPDGHTDTLGVNIEIPGDAPMLISATLDGLNSLTISNTNTYTHTFTATGTDTLSVGYPGSDFFRSGGGAIWSDDYKRITMEFTVNHEKTDVGTYFFSGFIGSVERVAPLIITNDPSYSAVSGKTMVIDASLSPFAAEWFTLEFYAPGGTLCFTRSVGSCHGGGKFVFGAIPPGDYKIKCVGELDYEGNEPFESQWYPNATGMADAEPVTFLAGQETEDIYFFLRSGPLPASAWTRQNSGVTQSLYWIHFIDSNTGWAVGGNGIYTTAPDPVIIKTTNGGETWVDQTSTTMTENLYSCYFVDENYGWAVGGSARAGGVCKIYYTTDGGTTWTEPTSQTNRRPVTVFFIDQNNGWICGDGGTIQHTTNGGGTWVLQDTPTTEHICGIHFVDANNGWAGAQHGVILHTTNGGTTWAQQPSGVEDALSPFLKRHFGSLDFVHTDEGDHGWVIGIDGTIVHTDNGGAHWAVQTSNTTERLWSVDFVDSDNGLVVGSNGLMLRTADGGETWTTENSGTTVGLISVSLANKNTGWAVGGEGTILKYGGVGITLTADFSGTPTSGTAPLNVGFTDQSTGSPTLWSWDFDNDGTVDATSQNPSHSYSNGGTYTVSLTVSDGTDSDTETKTNYILVNEPSVPGEWNIQTVEMTFGMEVDLALDQNGYPHISYYNNFSKVLEYATWDGSTWKIETVDSSETGYVGQHTSIALDQNGYPHISYFYPGNLGDISDLKYASWNGSTWNTQTVDSEGNVGQYTSIALDQNGYPHISYLDASNGDLKYASWDGSSWNTQTVDSEGYGSWNSIALDQNGYPHISYLGGGYNLKYAYWDGSSWNTETVDSEGDVGSYTSIALDQNDYPHISYFDGTNYDLKYATWNGSTWNIQTVDSENDVGDYTSIALDQNDYPHISYHAWPSSNDNLKYAYWDGSSWNIETVDSEGGSWTSIALDQNDYPHISYHAGGDLKYAFYSKYRDVNLADLILTLQVLAGMNPDNVCVIADINGDGKIGIAEAIYIMQHIAGIASSE